MLRSAKRGKSNLILNYKENILRFKEKEQTLGGEWRMEKQKDGKKGPGDVIKQNKSIKRQNKMY